MPVQSGYIAYFRRGKEPKLLTFKLGGQNVVITRMFVPQSFAAANFPDPNWLMVHIPLTWTGEYRLDAQELRKGEAVIARCPSGYFTRGSDRDALTIGVRIAAMRSAIAALSGRVDDVIQMPRVHFRPSAAMMTAIWDQYFGALDRAETDDDVAGLYLLPSALETDLIDLFATEYIAAARIDRQCRHDGKRAADVVCAASRLVLQSSGAMPSLSQLCLASGVAKTRLFECFQEVMGMAPYKALQSLRLYAAYQRLSDPENPPISVKQVALDAGYTKPGRFAERFNADFGILPSALLERTLAAWRTAE